MSEIIIGGGLGAAPLIKKKSSVSTNTELKAMAAEGAEAGTVLLAESQTGGRGRLGRSFSSRPGGLYMSLLLKFSAPDDRIASITALTGAAVAKTLNSFCGVNTEIKWPNDVLLNGKKLCGILTESTVTGCGINVVVGIGINVNQRDFPEELRTTACSLFTQTGVETDIDSLVSEILSELAEAYKNAPVFSESYLEYYREHCCTLGKTLQNGGVAEKIAEDFSLVIRMPDGTGQRKFFGELPPEKA